MGNTETLTTSPSSQEGVYSFTHSDGITRSANSLDEVMEVCPFASGQSKDDMALLMGFYASHQEKMATSQEDESLQTNIEEKAIMDEGAHDSDVLAADPAEKTPAEPRSAKTSLFGAPTKEDEGKSDIFSKTPKPGKPATKSKIQRPASLPKKQQTNVIQQDDRTKAGETSPPRPPEAHKNVSVPPTEKVREQAASEDRSANTKAYSWQQNKVRPSSTEESKDKDSKKDQSKPNPAQPERYEVKPAANIPQAAEKQAPAEVISGKNSSSNEGDAAPSKKPEHSEEKMTEQTPPVNHRVGSEKSVTEEVSKPADRPTEPAEQPVEVTQPDFPAEDLHPTDTGDYRPATTKPPEVTSQPAVEAAAPAQNITPSESEEIAETPQTYEKPAAAEPIQETGIDEVKPAKPSLESAEVKQPTLPSEPEVAESYEQPTAPDLPTEMVLNDTMQEIQIDAPEANSESEQRAEPLIPKSEEPAESEVSDFTEPEPASKEDENTNNLLPPETTHLPETAALSDQQSAPEVSPAEHSQIHAPEALEAEEIPAVQNTGLIAPAENKLEDAEPTQSFDLPEMTPVEPEINPPIELLEEPEIDGKTVFIETPETDSTEQPAAPEEQETNETYQQLQPLAAIEEVSELELSETPDPEESAFPPKIETPSLPKMENEADEREADFQENAEIPEFEIATAAQPSTDEAATVEVALREQTEEPSPEQTPLQPVEPADYVQKEVEESLAQPVAQEINETYHQLVALSAAEQTTEFASLEKDQSEVAAAEHEAATFPAPEPDANTINTGEENNDIPDFETFAAAQPLPEEATTLEDIQEQADEQPLEQTLVKLAGYLQTAEEEDAETEVSRQIPELEQTMRELQAALPKNMVYSPESAEAAPQITPEVTEKILRLLRTLGYNNPKEALLQLVAEHDITFLLQALECICERNQNRETKKSSITAPAAGADDTKATRLHLGKTAAGLVETFLASFSEAAAPSRVGWQQA